MWCECVCGHHRRHHPRVRGTRTGCGLCAVCGRESDEHVFVSHQYRRCDCPQYQEEP